jgi:phosphatidylserine decarboxylase
MSQSEVRDQNLRLTERLKAQAMDWLMPRLPKGEISHFTGKLVHLDLPQPLARLSVRAFAEAYQLNMQEAEFPVDYYANVGELFTRRLKPEARPLGQGVLHPADAEVLQAGGIGATLVQAKGIDYSLAQLLGSEAEASEFQGGLFLSYYLCPTDYHRVHASFHGQLLSTRHLPGEFWPVNSWSVSKIDSLYAINERVAMSFAAKEGRWTTVMIAATNVGNISATLCPDLSTRERGAGRAVRSFPGGEREVAAGDEIGIFRMGSSVVLLLDARLCQSLKLTESRVQALIGQRSRVRSSLGAAN